MAFECDFDFLSPEQNEKFAAFVNEMRDFSDKGGEVIRLSRELRAVTKERDNYKAMLEGASRACENLRREYRAYRDGVAAVSENANEAAELSAALERWRIEAEDFRERLKCANARLRGCARRPKRAKIRPLPSRRCARSMRRRSPCSRIGCAGTAIMRNGWRAWRLWSRRPGQYVSLY